MNKIKVWALLYVGMLVSSEHQNDLHINHRTSLIYQRFYLVKRLQHPMDSLHNREMQKAIAELDPSFFYHTEIQKAAFDIKNRKSLDSLYDLWQKFAAYQYLYDQAFEDEYIKLVCLLCMLKESIYEVRLCLEREQQLAFLDALTDACDYGSPCSRSYQRSQMLADITTDHIARRYFVIKRLGKAMQFLTLAHKRDKSPFEKIATRAETIDYIENIQDEIEQFNNIRIRECLSDLCRKKNLEPILRVCAECKRYRYIADDDFLKETLMSMFLVYKTMLMKNLSEQTEQIVLSEVQHILEVYEHLDRVSLDEALEAIDVATDRLIAIQSIQTGEQPNRSNWFMSGVLLCGFFAMNALNHFTIV